MSCEAFLKVTRKTQKDDFSNLTQEVNIKNPDDAG